MATKLKNIIKKLPMYMSIFILIITGILLILFTKNGIYRDALEKTEYGHSAAYARQISNDVKNICTYENNVVDGAKKSKAMGKDFSYLYAKMYVSENVDVSVDHAAYDNELDIKFKQFTNTINSNRMMLQTYNIQRKEVLKKCIEKQFDTSTRRFVAVSNSTSLIHSYILESNGYKYDEVFNYETGDSAVVLLIYDNKVFNKFKTNWKIFYICIQVITGLAIISVIYLLYVYMITKKHIKILCKAKEFLKKLLHKIRVFFTGKIYYPINTRKGVKILFVCSSIIVTILTLIVIFIFASIEYFKDCVPVGYSLDTIHDWISPNLYDYADFVLNINVEKPLIIYLIVYFLIFAIYHYFSSNVINSCRLLEDSIEKIYTGNYKFDKTTGIHTAFYDSILKLSNIGEGFEKTLEEKIKSERMKTELITNVSHDLKTPLTSIISYVDLLERCDELPEEAADYVKIISQKSERLKNMVFDLFELAKTTSGEIVINKTKLSLNKLIIQTLTDMDDNIKKSGLDIKLRLPEKDIFISSDGDRLYRVIQNIVGNALKYSLKGTRIYITEISEKNTVTVTVKNTASYEMNFTEEEILERFVRGDKARNTEGNGLGLSIAKEFTKACGGTFDIKIDGDQFNVILAFPIESSSVKKE